jgi:hypothetical protein
VEQIIDNPQKWVDSWAKLAGDIAKDDLLSKYVFLDLLNEPDSRGIR